VQGSYDELIAIERELAAIETGKDPGEFERLEEQLDDELDERLHPDS